MADDKPDFEALRAKRNAAAYEMIKEVAVSLGCGSDKVVSTFNPDSCYCNCPEGPCEHNWQGSRPLYNSQGRECGFESFCSRCNMGAMSHDMRFMD